MRPKEQHLAEPLDPGPSLPAGGVRMATITMPAAEAYVSFARMATTQVGAALGLSAGRVADLRLAVDEACGQFLEAAVPDVEVAGSLHLYFDRYPETLRVTVRGPISNGWPDREGLGWLVLVALASDVNDEAGPEPGIGTLTFVERLAPDDASREALWFTVP
jgi:hypothetical protein